MLRVDYEKIQTRDRQALRGDAAAQLEKCTDRMLPFADGFFTRLIICCAPLWFTSAVVYPYLYYIIQ
jgi:hypothetical protein